MINEAELKTATDDEVFEELKRCTVRQLFYDQEKFKESHLCLGWKHKNAQGTLWWISRVVEELRVRNARLNK
jgi:hypothetical protein